jgi:ABC-2 type transport system permease protein
MLLTGAASVASERQRGTLLAALTCGANGRELLAGKMLALWAFGLLMATPVLIALLAAALGTPATAARAAGLGAALSLALGLAAAGTVLVSALARDALSALLLGVVAWFALAIAAPPAVATLATLVAPAPTQADVERRIASALAAVGDAHDPDSAHFSAFRERVLAEYGVDRPEDLPVNFGGLVMLEGERLSSAAVAREIDRQRDAWATQQSLMSAAGWLLPTLALRDAVQAFAGTDLGHHRAFLDQAEQRRFATVQALNSLHAQKIKALNDRDQRLDASHWAAIPRAEIATPALAKAAPALDTALLQIGLWLLLALAALGFAGRRLERHAC